MAQTVTLYKGFSKKKNSTAVPAGSGTNFDCVWKEKTSVRNPVLLISDIDTSYTYAYFNGNYYFVTDHKLQNRNIYEVDLSIDVMATYRSEIFGYSCFVERSASNYDSMIIDPLLSQTTEIIYEGKTSLALPGWGSGALVMKVLGKSGLNAYGMSFSQMRDICDLCFDYNSYDQSLFTDVLAKSILNMSQYIKGLKWFPVAPSGASVPVISMGFTTFYLGSDVTLLTIGTYTSNKQWIAVTPYYADFRKYDDNYIKYEIFIPGIGLAHFPAYLISDGFYITYYGDFITGDCGAILENSAGQFAQLKGTFGCDYQIGGMTANTGVIGSLLNTVGSAATGNVIGTATGTINTIKNAFTPTQSILGGPGNFAELYYNNNVVVSQFAFKSKDFPTANLGRCSYQNLTLGNLSGYVKCAGASISIDGYDADREEINSILNSGFYVE